MSVPARIARRGLLGLLGAGIAVPALANAGWHDYDISGISPKLSLSMTRATDGKPVTEADYRGKVVLLYFGYTYCPDVCPLTLSNLAAVLGRLGPLADRVRVLFVTVDPNRDTLPLLKQYAAAFAPQMEGLRGTPDEVMRLARRYRVVYAVTPASPGHPYTVTHSAAIFAFGPAGNAQLLIPSLATQNADLTGVTVDLRRLLQGGRPGGLLPRLMADIRALGDRALALAGAGL